ncbi:MAG TPA: hypothetical protein DIT07_07875 [Sphingobacteriaceae bacterium]|nr:hypothetical protein [Sphingobacteriaceae bacterium]
MLPIRGFGFFNLVFGPVFSSIDDFDSLKVIFIKDYFVKIMLNRTKVLFQPSVYKNQNSITRQRVNNINHLNHKI